MKAILKSIVVFILLLGFVANMFSNLTVILSYEINKKYFAENLCENKMKPWMHCMGQCCMMKEMKAQQEKEKTPASNNLSEKLQLQLFSERKLSDSFFNSEKDFQYLSYSTFFISGNYSRGVFHPPTS